MSSVPSDGIFRGVVPSRDVAIRQPGQKIGLPLLTLRVPTDGAVARHSIKTTHKSQGDKSLRFRIYRDMSHLHAI